MFLPKKDKKKKVGIFDVAQTKRRHNNAYFSFKKFKRIKLQFCDNLRMQPKTTTGLHVCDSQVRCEGFVSVDDSVGGDVLLTVRLPQRAQLGPHVPPLVVDVLVAGRHLLDRVDVDIDVRGGVRGVEHLAEGQNKAACGVLEGEKNTKTAQ